MRLPILSVALYGSSVSLSPLPRHDPLLRGGASRPIQTTAGWFWSSLFGGGGAWITALYAACWIRDSMMCVHLNFAWSFPILYSSLGVSRYRASSLLILSDSRCGWKMDTQRQSCILHGSHQVSGLSLRSTLIYPPVLSTLRGPSSRSLRPDRLQRSTASMFLSDRPRLEPLNCKRRLVSSGWSISPVSAPSFFTVQSCRT